MQNITPRSLLGKAVLFSLLLHLIAFLVIPKFSSSEEHEPTPRDIKFFIEEIAVIKEEVLIPSKSDEIEDLFSEGMPGDFVTPAPTIKSVEPWVISPRLERGILADYINKGKSKEPQDKESKKLTKEELEKILKRLEKDMELKVLAGEDVSGKRVPQRRYIDIVRDQIVKQYFIPPKARVHKMRGSVVLKMTISAKGKIKKLIFLEHSDFPVLDMVARAAIERAAPFPDISDKVDLDHLDIIVPFIFKPD